MNRDAWAPGEKDAGQGREARLRMLDETGSTNDDARELARSGAPHGTAVAARRQSAGRGRRGHAWASDEGNLYLSVVLRPGVAPARLPGLAPACGVGVAGALRELVPAADVRLKWPNDLLAGGRKLGGILVEVERDAAVCGVGVNVASAPAGLAATSLAELGRVAAVDELARLVRERVVTAVDAWAAAGGDRPLDGILDEYQALLCWRGTWVRVIAPDGSERARGTLEGVDAWGRAIVDGVPYTAEQASLRPA